MLHMDRQGTVRRGGLLESVGIGGAVSGLLAGVVMIALSPLLSALTGIGMWDPPKLIAATVVGQAALATPGFAVGPVAIGTAVHLALSVSFGFVFGVVFRQMFHLTTDFGLPLLVGLCYGLLIFGGAFAVVLPALNPPFRTLYEAPMLLQNLIFGISLGGFYTLLRPQAYTTVVVRIRR